MKLPFSALLGLGSLHHTILPVSLLTFFFPQEVGRMAYFTGNPGYISVYLIRVFASFFLNRIYQYTYTVCKWSCTSTEEFKFFKKNMPIFSDQTWLDFKFQVVDYYALDKPNKYIKDQVIRRPGTAYLRPKRPCGVVGGEFQPKNCQRSWNGTHFGGINFMHRYGHFEGFSSNKSVLFGLVI